MSKIRAVVLGYGNRGARYSDYSVKHPEELEIVAVAEPVANRREHAAQLHQLPQDRVYADWHEVAQQPKMAIRLTDGISFIGIFKVSCSL